MEFEDKKKLAGVGDKRRGGVKHPSDHNDGKQERARAGLERTR